MKKKVLYFLALCLSFTALARPDSVMFPACFQKDVWNICEGYPGLLGFYPVNEPESKKSILHLEVPAFLKLRSSHFRGGPGPMDRFRETAVSRNGIPYRRIEIQLSRAFVNQWRQFKKTTSFPFYLKQSLIFDATPGAAGKRAALYWRLETDRGAGSEKNITVNVLPRFSMPQTPPSHFSVGISDIETPSGKYDDYAQEMCAFWKGLSRAEIFGNLTYNDPVPDPQFASSASSGSVCFFPNFRPDPFEREIRLGKYNHKYPTVANHHGLRGLALAYMIDDLEGMFAEYLKNGILRFKKNHPAAQYLRWDYEPLASQYSEYDLEVFSRRYLKLNKTLPYAEIEKRYPKQWSNFRYEQSAQLVRKYSEALRRYWPDVKFMMVSGFLERQRPETNYRSAYTPLDLRDTEHLFDVHSPMLYWQGTDFYDDVEFNLRYLKKPFMPWIDPAEHRDVFYQRYTPAGVRQNILACAALKARGIVFYPASGLDGAFFPAITDAVNIIGGTEKIIRDGKDITAQCSVRAASVIEMKMTDLGNREVSVQTPEVEPRLRWRVYRSGERFAVALFNYNQEKVIVRVNVPGFAKDALVKLAPMDATILTELPDAQKIRPELEQMQAELKKNTKFPPLKHGGSAVVWIALDRKALPALTSGRCTLAIDPLLGAPRSWACPYPSWDPLINPRKQRGHLGRIFLMNQGNPVALDFQLVKFLIDRRRPSLLLRHIQKPFAGFQELENEFEGLHIDAQWILSFNGKQAVLKFSAVNRNTRGKTIPAAFKIHTHPRIGNKFGPTVAPGILEVDGRKVATESEGNFMLVRPGAAPQMSALNLRRMSWNHPERPVTIVAEGPRLREKLTITPDSKTAAFYNWFNKSEGQTAEFLTEKYPLKPGESVSFEFIFDYQMEKKR